MPKITIIAGARPNFMKIAPIIKAIEKAKDSRGKYRFSSGAYRSAL